MAPKAGGLLTRKERERLRHRREILDAAERVFVRKGYHLATVEEIAREAEFAVGTLYNFFKNKEDLHAEVINRITGDFMAAFEREVLSRRDPNEAIGVLIELHLTHFETHRGFFRVFLETFPGSHLAPKQALPPESVRRYDRYVAAVSEIFARGVKDDSFDELDPFYLTLCLEGIINAFVAYWARNEPAEPVAARAEKLKEAFLGRLRIKRRRARRAPGKRGESGGKPR